MSFRRSRPSVAIAAVVTAIVITVSCSGGAGTQASARPVDASVEVHGGVEQVFALGLQPDAKVTLIDGRGRPVLTPDLEGEDVRTRVVDRNGAIVFRYVPPGRGYRIRQQAKGTATTVSAPVEVASWQDAPDPELYTSQTLEVGPDNTGYGYLETRDGTLLSYQVRLPGPPDEGPYPTVVEYSGYDPANPTSQQPSTMLAGILGFAVVGVNMRGTGCSGGSFQFFERQQSTDGYDAIETVAAQPWVAHGEVGMVGISYPGISQLFTAQLRPPHLAAIAPLSVIDDTWRGTLYPGGIFNDGFALSWAEERTAGAMDARLPEPPEGSGEPTPGQGWARERIAQGDEVCADNQQYRDQSPSQLSVIRRETTYPDRHALGDEVSPATFVDQIDVPVFLAGAWQDEQTGGHFTRMLDRFEKSPSAHFTLTNGTHTDSMSPAVLVRWLEFLHLYVSRKVPDTSLLRTIMPLVVKQIIGTDQGIPVPPDRWAGITSYEEAKAMFEADPAVRVLLENGGVAAPGIPGATTEVTGDRWPLPSAQATSLFLQPGGGLEESAPTTPDDGDGAFADYAYDPAARPRASFSGGSGDIWKPQPAYEWAPLADGAAVAYAGRPLAADLTVIGPVAAELWVRSTAEDTDLQVTLTEVRPDGGEVFVQSGWLRASQRALDAAASTELAPVLTQDADDVEPLEPDEWTKVAVPLHAVGHVFRAGSRIRVSVSAPGGDRPFWTFDTLDPAEGQRDAVAHSVGRPSRLVLPVVPGVAVQGPPPACGALRGQPCRTYAPAVNGG